MPGTTSDLKSLGIPKEFVEATTAAAKKNTLRLWLTRSIEFPVALLGKHRGNPAVQRPSADLNFLRFDPRRLVATVGHFHRRPGPHDEPEPSRARTT